MGWLFGLALLAVACGEDEPSEDTRQDTEVTTDAPDTIEVDTSDGVDTAPETDDTTGPEVDSVGPGCGELALTGALEANDVAGVFTLGGEIDLGLGDPEIPDIVVFELFSDAAGTFRLGEGANENYATCDQCLRVIEDASSGSARQFFPTAGSIEVEHLVPGGRDVRFTLSGLELIEVTIRQADLRSVPVEGGRCYRRVEPFSLETAACVAACGDHVCGDDGCGGVCGEGCEAGVCSLDGLRCEADTSVCQDVAVAGILANPAAGVYRLSLTELGLGSVSATDFLQLEFYENATGGFSLGAGTNRNYRTCGQCVRLIVDGRREFFQREGLLTVSPASEPIAVPGEDAFVDLTFSGVVLQEVTLDDEFNSTPKPGGACVRLVVDGPLRSAEL
ncbi:MAG TPA: hypothetical protein PK095_23115 [Myxococcota bacterium]|nr:hypothetical protein [Myxococcota bacterium]